MLLCQVCDMLKRVFEGFEAVDTFPLFILMGSFVSKPLTAEGGREAALAAFSSLADAICSCPKTAERSKFLLLPGEPL